MGNILIVYKIIFNKCLIITFAFCIIEHNKDLSVYFYFIVLFNGTLQPYNYGHTYGSVYGAIAYKMAKSSQKLRIQESRAVL